MKIRNYVYSLIFIGLLNITLGALADEKVTTISADVGFVQRNNLPNGSDQISPIRLQALKDAAISLGARGALAWRSLQINRTLNKEANYLNHAFDFNLLLINGDVLPPVITQGDNSLNLSDTDAIRTSTKIYKIVSPARFVTVPPTWRNYLYMAFAKPTLPDHSLLPTTQVEADLWNNYFKEGWKTGLKQANDIFMVNLNRLKRDYAGMVLYRQLLAQNIVSAPYIAKANLGVTGDTQEMRINDRIARITDPSKLQIDPQQWKPILTK